MRRSMVTMLIGLTGLSTPLAAQGTGGGILSLGLAYTVGSGWQSVDCADAPVDDALLALAERLCNKHEA